MLVLLALSATLASSPASCEALKSLTLPNTTIVAAEMKAAGPFVQAGRGAAPAAPPAAEGRGRGGPGGPGSAPPAPQIVPAHCRINAILRPSADSEIEMEAWLPDNGNGKFQFVGGGGWAGIISFPAMVTAVQKATRPHRPTPATRVATRSSRSAIRRKWSTSPIAPFTNRR
jgi:feruloyl esterase